MVGLKHSRLARSVDSFADDDYVKYDRNLKGNSGCSFKTVKVDYCMTESYRRGLKDIDDSMKEYAQIVLGDVDPEYLEYLTSDHTSARKSHDKKALNIDGTDNDPRYDMFWSCLKPYGTSFILEVSKNNGLSEPIIYGLDESDEWLNQKAKGMSENIVIEQKIEEKKRVLRSHNKRLISLKNRSVNKVIDTHKVETERNSLRDEDYMTTMKTECSNVIGQDGHDRLLVREANKRERSNENSRKERERHSLRSKGNVIETMNVEANLPFRKNDDKYAGFCIGSSVEGTRVISRDRPHLKGFHEAEKNLQQPYDGTFYVNRNGVCSVMPEISYDVSAVKEDDLDVYTGNPQGEISSGFMKELIENLRKPYNDKELKELFNRINTRKPMLRHMELRGRIAEYYTSEKEGKSYLDVYIVLRRKVDAAKNDYEKLNLLRGFFFWMQNLTREDSFEPWKNKACLAVLPQTVRKG